MRLHHTLGENHQRGAYSMSSAWLADYIIFDWGQSHRGQVRLHQRAVSAHDAQQVRHNPSR